MKCGYGLGVWKATQYTTLLWQVQGAWVPDGQTSLLSTEHVLDQGGVSGPALQTGLGIRGRDGKEAPLFSFNYDLIV